MRKPRFRIRKEYYRMEGGRAMIVLGKDNYEHSLRHIQELLEEAKKDFPGFEIDPANVVIQHYGGVRRKGQLGIEIEVPFDQIPDHYVDTFSPEPTL